MEPKLRFKTIREYYNLSMRSFGEQLGLTASGVSAIEYGTRSLGEKHIKLICAAFPDISEHWLRTGEGDMFLPKSTSSLPAELAQSPMVRAILETYLDLDPQGRALFDRFFADVVARYKGEQPAVPEPSAAELARAAASIPLPDKAESS